MKGRINGVLILLSEALLSDSQVVCRPLLQSSLCKEAEMLVLIWIVFAQDFFNNSLFLARLNCPVLVCEKTRIFHTPSGMTGVQAGESFLLWWPEMLTVPSGVFFCMLLLQLSQNGVNLSLGVGSDCPFGHKSTSSAWRRQITQHVSPHLTNRPIPCLSHRGALRVGVPSSFTSHSNAS